MRSFYIIVQRGHEDLYAALRQAFRSREGFYVMIDRRSSPVATPPRRRQDRRRLDDDWGAAHFVVAECVDPFGS